MKLETAETLAKKLIRQHLPNGDCRFEFDRSKQRFGCCHHRENKITLSRNITALNPESEVKDTILHEIAHALCGHNEGHSWIWKQKAREIGAKPSRCYDDEGNGRKVVQPIAPWLGTCPTCGKTSTAFRRTRVSCGKCSNVFDPKHLIQWTSNNKPKEETMKIKIPKKVKSRKLLGTRSNGNEVWVRPCPCCGETITHDGEWSRSQSKTSHEKKTKCVECRFAKRAKKPTKKIVRTTPTKPTKKTSPQPTSVRIPKHLIENIVNAVVEKLTTQLNMIKTALGDIHRNVLTPVKTDHLASQLGDLTKEVRKLAGTIQSQPKTKKPTTKDEGVLVNQPAVEA